MSDPIVLIRNRLADLAAIYAQIIQGGSAISSLQLLKKGDSERYHAQIDRGAYRIEATLSTPALAALTVAESVKDLVDAHLRTKGYVMPSFDQAFAALRQACADSAFNPALTADKLSSLPKPEPKEPPMLKPEPKSAAPANETVAEPTPLYKVVPKPKAKKAEEKPEAKAAKTPAPARPAQRFSSVEKLITPAVAQRYIDRTHPNQRSVNKMAVARYAAAMKAGRWEHNHQNSVSFQDGLLVDGQHRLHAIIESGVSLWMFVIEYEPGSTVGGIDRTHPRNLGDDLDMAGVTSRGFGRKFAAVARSLYLLSMDKAKQADIEEHTKLSLTANLDTIQLVWTAFGGKMSADVMAAFAYAYPINEDAIVEMIRKVKENDGLVKGTGAWFLRRTLDGDYQGHFWNSEKAVRALKCIMLELTGKTQSEVKTRRGDTTPDSVVWARKERQNVGVCPLAYPEA